MAVKTGIVAATLFVKSLCHVLLRYRPAMDAVIASAVSAGHITSVQAATLETWLNGAQAACDIIRTVSGY